MARIVDFTTIRAASDDAKPQLDSALSKVGTQAERPSAAQLLDQASTASGFHAEGASTPVREDVGLANVSGRSAADMMQDMKESFRADQFQQVNDDTAHDEIQRQVLLTSARIVDDKVVTHATGDADVNLQNALANGEAEASAAESAQRSDAERLAQQRSHEMMRQGTADSQRASDNNLRDNSTRDHLARQGLQDANVREGLSRKGLQEANTQQTRSRDNVTQSLRNQNVAEKGVTEHLSEESLRHLAQAEHAEELNPEDFDIPAFFSTGPEETLASKPAEKTEEAEEAVPQEEAESAEDTAPQTAFSRSAATERDEKAEKVDEPEAQELEEPEAEEPKTSAAPPQEARTRSKDEAKREEAPKAEVTADTEAEAEPEVDKEVPKPGDEAPAAKKQEEAPRTKRQEEAPRTQKQEEAPQTQKREETPAPKKGEEAPRTQKQEETPATRKQEETPAPKKQEEAAQPQLQRQEPAARTEREEAPQEASREEGAEEPHEQAEGPQRQASAGAGQRSGGAAQTREETGPQTHGQEATERPQQEPTTEGAARGEEGQPEAKAGQGAQGAGGAARTEGKAGQTELEAAEGGPQAEGETAGPEGKGTPGEAGAARPESRGTRGQTGAARTEGGAARAEGGAGRTEGGAARAEGGAARAEGGAARTEGGAARTEGGAARAEGGAARAEGGAARAEGGAARAEGGAARTEGGAARTEGGAARAEGGAARTEGGAARTEGGAARTEGGAARTEGGAARTEGGAARAEGGAARAEGGAARTEGGAARTEGGAARTEGGATQSGAALAEAASQRSESAQARQAGEQPGVRSTTAGAARESGPQQATGSRSEGTAPREGSSAAAGSARAGGEARGPSGPEGGSGQGRIAEDRGGVARQQTWSGAHDQAAPSESQAGDSRGLAPEARGRDAEGDRGTRRQGETDTSARQRPARGADSDAPVRSDRGTVQASDAQSAQPRQASEAQGARQPSGVREASAQQPTASKPAESSERGTRAEGAAGAARGASTEGRGASGASTEARSASGADVASGQGQILGDRGGLARQQTWSGAHDQASPSELGGGEAAPEATEATTLPGEAAATAGGRPRSAHSAEEAAPLSRRGEGATQSAGHEAGPQAGRLPAEVGAPSSRAAAEVAHAVAPEGLQPAAARQGDGTQAHRAVDSDESPRARNAVEETSGVSATPLRASDQAGTASRASSSGRVFNNEEGAQAPAVSARQGNEPQAEAAPDDSVVDGKAAAQNPGARTGRDGTAGERGQGTAGRRDGSAVEANRDPQTQGSSSGPEQSHGAQASSGDAGQSRGAQMGNGPESHGAQASSGDAGQSRGAQTGNGPESRGAQPSSSDAGQSRGAQASSSSDAGQSRGAQASSGAESRGAQTSSSSDAGQSRGAQASSDGSLASQAAEAPSEASAGRRPMAGAGTTESPIGREDSAVDALTASARDTTAQIDADAAAPREAAGAAATEQPANAASSGTDTSEAATATGDEAAANARRADAARSEAATSAREANVPAARSAELAHTAAATAAPAAPPRAHNAEAASAPPAPGGAHQAAEPLAGGGSAVALPSDEDSGVTAVQSSQLETRGAASRTSRVVPNDAASSARRTDDIPAAAGGDEAIAGGAATSTLAQPVGLPSQQEFDAEIEAATAGFVEADDVVEVAQGGEAEDAAAAPQDAQSLGSATQLKTETGRTDRLAAGTETEPASASAASTGATATSEGAGPNQATTSAGTSQATTSAVPNQAAPSEAPLDPLASSGSPAADALRVSQPGDSDDVDAATGDDSVGLDERRIDAAADTVRAQARQASEGREAAQRTATPSALTPEVAAGRPSSSVQATHVQSLSATGTREAAQTRVASEAAAVASQVSTAASAQTAAALSRAAAQTQSAASAQSDASSERAEAMAVAAPSAPAGAASSAPAGAGRARDASDEGVRVFDVGTQDQHDASAFAGPATLSATDVGATDAGSSTEDASDVDASDAGFSAEDASDAGSSAEDANDVDASAGDASFASFAAQNAAIQATSLSRALTVDGETFQVQHAEPLTIRRADLLERASAASQPVTLQPPVAPPTLSPALAGGTGGAGGSSQIGTGSDAPSGSSAPVNVTPTSEAMRNDRFAAIAGITRDEGSSGQQAAPQEDGAMSVDALLELAGMNEPEELPAAQEEQFLQGQVARDLLLKGTKLKDQDDEAQDFAADMDHTDPDLTLEELFAEAGLPTPTGRRGVGRVARPESSQDETSEAEVIDAGQSLFELEEVGAMAQSFAGRAAAAGEAPFAERLQRNSHAPKAPQAQQAGMSQANADKIMTALVNQPLLALVWADMMRMQASRDEELADPNAVDEHGQPLANTPDKARRKRQSTLKGKDIDAFWKDLWELLQDPDHTDPWFRAAMLATALQAPQQALGMFKNQGKEQEVRIFQASSDSALEPTWHKLTQDGSLPKALLSNLRERRESAVAGAGTMQSSMQTWLDAAERVFVRLQRESGGHKPGSPRADAATCTVRAMQAVTGRQAFTLDLSQPMQRQTLSRLLARTNEPHREPIIATTYPDAQEGFMPEHPYAILGTHEEGDQLSIALSNPSGIDGFGMECTVFVVDYAMFLRNMQGLGTLVQPNAVTLQDAVSDAAPTAAVQVTVPDLNR